MFLAGFSRLCFDLRLVRLIRCRNGYRAFRAIDSDTIDVIPSGRRKERSGCEEQDDDEPTADEKSLSQRTTLKPFGSRNFLCLTAMFSRLTSSTTDPAL